MVCKGIEELLSPYLEDELNPEEKLAVEEHLKTCQICADLFSFMKETKESLANFPELDVSENLINQLYSIPSKKKRFKLSLDFLVRPSLQPVFTAATILLIMISFYIFHPNKNLIDKSIDRQIHLGFSKIGRLYAKAESFTDSLAEYKDNILVSIKNVKFFRENEE